MAKLNYSVKALPASAYYKRSKHQLLIEEFKKSNASYAIVEMETSDEYATPYSLTSSLKYYIKHHRDTTVDVRTINGQVYLIKKGA